MKSPTVQDAFQAGLQHHQAGRFPQAEKLYRLALDSDVRNTHVLHILGVLLHQTGRNGESIDLIRRAVEIDSSVPDFHNSLGNVLRTSNRLDEAVAEFRAAIAINNEYAEAYANLGSVLHDQGKLDDAIEAYAAALRLRDDLPEIHNNLGITLQAKCEFHRAMDSFQQAIRLKPDFVEAHHNLAVALQASDQPAAAEKHFTIAVRLAPEFHEARLHLANLLHNRGELHDAEAQLRKLIQLNPAYVLAHNNLANVLRDMGRIPESIRACEQAISLRPDLSTPHVNLGMSLLSAGRLDDAIGCFRNAIHLQPGDASIHDRLGSALFEAGLLDEALAEYRVALQLDRNSVSAGDHLLFTLHCHPDYDSPRLLSEHIAWSARHAEPLGQDILPYRNDRSPERKLRIGYVSPDFRQHPTGRFLLPLFSSHDRKDFEIVAYSGVGTPDDVTHEIRRHSDAWHDVLGLSDSKLADLIRSHEIDVLVDLSLHSPGNRLLVFARRPAPVQISYLGYPSTTGLSAIAGRITDPMLDPSSKAPIPYTEANLPVPTYWCYRPPANAPEVTALPALAAGHVTFGCLDHVSKISSATLNLWRQVLDSVADSRLFLCVPEGRARARLIDALGGPNRIMFGEYRIDAEYLRMFAGIDIALDTLPFNGIGATCDALWMGVPVVTLAGQTAVGRAGSSILSSAGLPELIANSADQYVQIARELARDNDKVIRLRSSLRTQLAQSRLCNASAYARDIENAYRTAWRNWC